MFQSVKKACGAVCGGVVSAVSRVGDYLGRAVVVPALFALGLVAAGAEMAAAQSPDLIPDSPVDMPALIAEGTEKMGLVVTAAIGSWFIFMIVRKGLRWARSAF